MRIILPSASEAMVIGSKIINLKKIERANIRCETSKGLQFPRLESDSVVSHVVVEVSLCWTNFC